MSFQKLSTSTDSPVLKSNKPLQENAEIELELQNTNSEPMTPNNISGIDNDNVVTNNFLIEEDEDGKKRTKKQKRNKKDPTNPEETWNFFSFATFFFAEPLVLKGFFKKLKIDDIWPIHTLDKSQELCRRFEKLWAKEQLKKRPSFSLVAARLLLPYFLFSTFLYTLGILCQIASVEFIKLFLSSLQTATKRQGYYDPYLYALGLFLINMLGSFLIYHSNVLSQRTGSRIKTLIYLSVYKKAMTVGIYSTKEFNSGQISTLVASDAQRVIDAFGLVNVGLVSPLQIAIIIGLLYRLIQYYTFIGLAIILLSAPLNGFMAIFFTTLRKKIVLLTDERVRTITEALQSIRVIKMYAWEAPFVNKINKIRTKEVIYLFYFAVVRTILIFVINFVPTLVTVTVFLTYAATGHELNPSVVFPALTYFNLLRIPLFSMPFLVAILGQLKVSMSRTTEFLTVKNIDQSRIKRTDTDDEPIGFSVNNATFSYGQDNIIENINLSVKKGEIVMVVGSVGSGKSSLCLSVLGETICKEGNVSINGRVAYVSQTAYVVNDTVKGNILFGSKYDEQKYKNIIHACALEKDLEIFTHGDATEIGERGVNLSGGQKQRISMARAVYNDADIYILDDPLSAVDAHVAKHLFFECINKILKNKAVLLITNQLNFLQYATKVAIIGNKTIVAQDTYANLMKSSEHDYVERILKQYSVQSSEDEEPEEKVEKKEDIKNEFLNYEANFEEEEEEVDPSPKEKRDPKDIKRITSDEKSASGSVNMKVYLYYAWSGTLLLAFFSFLFFSFEAGLKATTDFWLGHWYNSETPEEFQFNLYMYVLLAFVSAISVFFRGFFISLHNLLAGHSLHKKMIAAIFLCPLSFFESNPLGRITNRISKDQDLADNVLPGSLTQLLFSSFSVLSALIVISVVIPWILIPLAPIAFLFLILLIYYRKTMRQLQRFEAVTRSPIFAQISETLNGIVSIRAYGAQDRFITNTIHAIDKNTVCFMSIQIIQQCLGLRLDFLGYMVLLLTALFLAIGRDSLALAGLALSYGVNMVQNLNRASVLAADTEVKMNSIERIYEYALHLPKEPKAHIEDPNRSKDWCKIGKIEYKNVVMRYRPDLPVTLKGVNITVEGGEKFAIVGRTGSGKSSLMLVLFRMLEIESGQILIDGFDTKNMGLTDLKSQLAIIPQDPCLFSGTIRSNLDPFNVYSDEEIWHAIEAIQLKDVVDRFDDKLYATVSPNGDNFSQGQRQLICLGRALLKKSKILVMDEATASVDVETDNLIQICIRKQFKDSTVIVIAHRLNTIIDCDRILVMSEGNVAELDKPINLLNMPDGIFKSMVAQTGEENFNYLKKVAMGEYKIFS